MGESSRQRAPCRMQRMKKLSNMAAERHANNMNETKQDPNTHENGRKQPIVRPVAKSERKLDILRTTIPNKGCLLARKTLISVSWNESPNETRLFSVQQKEKEED